MREVDNFIAVQKMQEYIEKNICKKLTLKEISNIAGYSPWHSGRIFKEIIGKTLFEYIRALRLTKAAIILRDEDERILDIALDFVFDSHEGFTRAFSKEFGISPKRYSNNTPPIKLFLPYKAFDTYKAMNKSRGVSKMKDARTVFVQVIEREARKVLIKRGKKAKEYFSYCEEVGCDVWGVLTSVKEALYEPIGMWLPKHLIKDGTSEYIQGVELPESYNKDIPDGYEIIELPPCSFMIFQGEPYDDSDFMEEIQSVWNHIEKFNPKIYGYQWTPEKAPRFQLSPMGERGYIEGRPVKKI